MILVVVAALVVSTGFGYSVSKYNRLWRIWPWGSWAMFTFDSDIFTRLQAKGTLEDGRETFVDLNRWFRYSVAFEKRRYSALGRYPDRVRKLAAYLCQRYNEEARPGKRLVTITIWDTAWSREPGRRRHMEEVPEAERKTHLNLSQYACPSQA